MRYYPALEIIYLTENFVKKLHRRIIAISGNASGLRDENALLSALALPQQSAFGQDAYPSFAEKAAALGYSIIQNHPFVDGNKRIGHAAMEAFLLANGFILNADVDDEEALVLGIASGNVSRQELSIWIEEHLIPLPKSP
jgi:death on curing protein